MAAERRVYIVKPAAVATMATATGTAHGACSSSCCFGGVLDGDGVDVFDDDMLLLYVCLLCLFEL
jgi:hypothetical protein